MLNLKAKSGRKLLYPEELGHKNIVYLPFFWWFENINISRNKWLSLFEERETSKSRPCYQRKNKSNVKQYSNTNNNTQPINLSDLVFGFVKFSLQSCSVQIRQFYVWSKYNFLLMRDQNVMFCLTHCMCIMWCVQKSN